MNYWICWYKIKKWTISGLVLWVNSSLKSRKGITLNNHIYYQGFVWQTIKLFTLKNTDSLFIGRSWAIEPSKNLRFISVYGLRLPYESLQYKSVAPYIKGIEQLAEQALHIITLGDVR